MTGRHLPVPLTVSLRFGDQRRNITRLCGDVRFRSTIPGGYATCTVDLNEPLDRHDGLAVAFAMLRITDGESGAVVWEGRLEDPGKSATSAGQVWSLSAYGPQAHARDFHGPYVAISSNMAAWVAAPGNQKWANGSVGQVNDITDAPIFDGLQVSAESGVELAHGVIVASWTYPVLRESGQILGTISGTFVNGRLSDGDHKVSLTVGIDRLLSSPRDIGLEDEISFNDQHKTDPDEEFPPPSGPTTTPYMAPRTFLWRRAIDWQVLTGTESVPALRWIWRGTGDQITGAQHWLGLGEVKVRPVMRDQYGNQLPASSPFPVDHAKSGQVFADLMGHRLTGFDPDTTTIEAGTDGLITHCEYPDATTTTDQILTDLMEQERNLYFWAAWESYQRGTRWRARAEWSLWPTDIRFTVGREDGLELPTSTAELYDSVSVRWKDASGALRTTVRALANDILTAAGISRRGSTDLGDNVASDEAAAFAHGDGWLADHAFPQGRGTVTVARALTDRLTGARTPPWRLLPGVLVQVRGMDPWASAQTGTRNGRNIFRLVATEFDSRTGAVTLELDVTPPTIFDLAATANRDRITRRR